MKVKFTITDPCLRPWFDHNSVLRHMRVRVWTPTDWTTCLIDLFSSDVYGGLWWGAGLVINGHGTIPGAWGVN